MNAPSLVGGDVVSMVGTRTMEEEAARRAVPHQEKKKKHDRLELQQIVDRTNRQLCFSKC
jgi:hypothetical protein